MAAVQEHIAIVNNITWPELRV